MIGLAIATKLEAEPLFASLKLKKRQSDPFPIYESDTTILIITGIGKINAAAASATLIHKFQPEVVVNLGAAGATGLNCVEGKTYHISAVFDLDRPHFRSGKPHYFTLDTLPGFDSKTLATRDKAVVDSKDRSTVSEIAELVDMEGVAVSQVSSRLNIPHYLFKQVTDTPDHQTDQDIVKNIRKYREAMAAFFLKEIFPAVNSR